MTFTVKQFILSLLLLVMLILYGLFINYFLHQRELTANVIMNTLRNDLSELSYVLSKHIKKAPIKSARALLDRKAANNAYIRAIAVFDDAKMLVSTDQTVLNTKDSHPAYHTYNESIYDHLMHAEVLEEELRYYEGKDLKSYRLLFYIEKDYIRAHFAQKKNRFILLFVFIPIIMITLMWISIRKFIIFPLEALRRYAHEQSHVPAKIHIRELEYIRTTLAKTFTRLEEEREDLYKLSRTDTLSGLANRNYLHEKVDEIIAQHQREEKEFALLFLDLDHFKSINDSLGHDIGDELLKKIAHAIHNILRGNDFVARIGGDEFVIVLTHYDDEFELIEIVKRIQEQLMKPWQIQTFPIHVTSSIGITTYPKDGKDMLTLMKNADIAMYEAKEKGRQGYHFFTKELNQKTQEYIELTNNMRDAFKDNQYELYYQPQNRVKDSQIIGAEALIRWKHPEKGMISPYIFIPIAEHNGFIVELGMWILENALKQKKAWEDKGIELKLSINIAAKQMQHENFLHDLRSLLKKYPVNTRQLYFEITEYIFLHNSHAVIKTFEAIKELGISLSLDDFGTGYSSLSYLKTFPIDSLKIDKTFMDDFSSKNGSVFIQTIINMASTLNLEVVCEGVELQEQVNYLKTLQCEYYQGYICSPPLPIDEFEELYMQQD